MILSCHTKRRMQRLSMYPGEGIRIESICTPKVYKRTYTSYHRQTQHETKPIAVLLAHYCSTYCLWSNTVITLIDTCLHVTPARG